MNLSRTVEIVPSTAKRVGLVSTAYYCPSNVSDAEGVMFLWLGTSHTAMKTSGAFHLQGSSYTSAGWTNIGSSILINTSAISAGLGLENVVVVDCHKPTRKWIRLAVHHTTGDQSVVAIKYGLRRMGTTEALSSSGIGKYALSVSAT